MEMPCGRTDRESLRDDWTRADARASASARFDGVMRDLVRDSLDTVGEPLLALSLVAGADQGPVRFREARMRHGIWSGGFEPDGAVECLVVTGASPRVVARLLEPVRRKYEAIFDTPLRFDPIVRVESLARPEQRLVWHAALRQSRDVFVHERYARRVAPLVEAARQPPGGWSRSQALALLAAAGKRLLGMQYAQAQAIQAAQAERELALLAELVDLPPPSGQEQSLAASWLSACGALGGQLRDGVDGGALALMRRRMSGLVEGGGHGRPFPK